MLQIIFCLVLVGLMLLSIALLKVYRHVPVKELKRQARQGDELAKLFYRVVGYGMSLDILLWSFIGLSSAAFFVLIANLLPWPLAFLGLITVIFFGFAWLPNAHISQASVIIAKYVTPPLHWTLEHLQPILVRLVRFAERFRPVSLHTGLYTKEDIVDLIEKQKVQIDNRITKEELGIVAHALQFGDKKVSEVMTPRRVLKTVSTHDMLGPVLMDELHDSGHSRFPVYQDKPDNIIGTLYLRDALSAKAGGFVKDVMRKEVFYVNQQQSLARVLDAFIKTKHHQFLVVNSFEEIVGVITIEDIVEQILGKQIIDEFDSYDDLRVVAAMEAEKDRKSHKTVVESEEVSEETPKEDKKEETSENSKQPD